MTSLLRFLAAAALCALYLTTPAAAQEIDWSGEPINDPLTASAIQIAQAHFAQSAGCPLQVQFFDDPSAHVAARGSRSACRIWIDRDVWAAPAVTFYGVSDPVGYCHVIVHEYGHVLGLLFDNPADPAHSPDPLNVMYASPHSPVAGCQALQRPGWRRPPATGRSWPCWAKASSRTRELYFDGETAQAKRAYQRLSRARRRAACPPARNPQRDTSPRRRS